LKQGFARKWNTDLEAAHGLTRCFWFAAKAGKAQGLEEIYSGIYRHPCKEIALRFYSEKPVF
jgi:hypothetical protein